MAGWRSCGGKGGKGGKAYAPKKEKKQLEKERQQRNEQPQKVTTQTFAVKFDDQVQCQKQYITAEIVRCQQCDAILTSASTLLNAKQYDMQKLKQNLSQNHKKMFLQEPYQKIWICEFCCHHNKIDKSYEPPKIQKPCFLIKKGNQKKQNILSNLDDDQKILIFCIDTSSSMDFKPFDSKKTRLGCVRQAICDEIKRMKFQGQKWKVGLITFGTIVRLIGDGTQFNAMNLSQQVYDYFEQIVKETQKIENFCQPVEKSYKNLKDTVQSLQTYGVTALGPALLASVQLSSKGAIGSKVIICTDGQANKGLRDDAFYDRVSDYAKNKRVVVNVLGLKGDNCNLKSLSKLSLATGGAILKIDPKALGTQFSKITKDQVLGTESFMTITMNKIFNFKNVKPQFLSKDKTTIKQDIGNFTAQTQVAFEFQVIDYAQARNSAQIQQLFDKEKVPMQMQLNYTGRDGSKFLQVITQFHDLTSNQKDMFNDINFTFFATSNLQRASRMIKDQNFDQAKSIIEGYKSSVINKFNKTDSKTKKLQIQKFNGRIEKLEKILNSKICKKREINQNQPVSTNKVKRGRDRKIKKEKQQKQQILDSDDQQQYLVKFMRERSRSRSNSPQEEKIEGINGRKMIKM